MDKSNVNEHYLQKWSTTIACSITYCNGVCRGSKKKKKEKKKRGEVSFQVSALYSDYAS